MSNTPSRISFWPGLRNRRRDEGSRDVQLQQHLVADAERKLLDVKAQLRALELATGRTLDPDAGRYWLRRVWALEHLEAAVRARDEVGVRRALKELHELPAPKSNPADHATEEQS
jgi:hypothetical protein